VIEGVMGLFDGASGRGELASTGHVAKLLQAPVVLVIDAASMARSAAAIVHGYSTFDPDIDVAGVIFNKVGSDTHEQLLREAVEPLGVPVVGVLRRDERVSAPERHLGLVPAAEREQHTRTALDALGASVAATVDLDAVLALARAAPDVPGEAWTPEPAGEPAAGARIAIARGPAFSFHYEENLELLAAAGAELLPFDPLSDAALPAQAGALVLAGGFPEVFGAELAANEPLRASIREFVAAGRPVLAECGGLLYLCRELDGHRMCGAIPARAEMTKRLTLGYREATAQTATPWIEAGESVRGHEFHYTRVEAEVELSPAWRLSARGIERSEGYATGALQASYLHVHWAAHPQLALRLARAARVGQPAAA
jgi:cobyrinic acid a,c-diamide synthase